MRFKLRNLILPAVIIFLIAPYPVSAQESGSIQAIATVLPALSVTGVTDLNFETVIPGTDKFVDKATSGLAGEFHIQGGPNAEVILDLTLPTTLANNDSTAFMNIVFSGTDASYDDETGGGQPAPAGIIDPRISNTLDLGATGQLDIWMGGEVQPSVAQTGGDYAADVVLTVTATGN